MILAELKTANAIGDLECLQARFFAKRATIFGIDYAHAEILLALLLANQACGNTVASLEDLQALSPLSAATLPLMLRTIQQVPNPMIARAADASSGNALVLWEERHGKTWWGFSRAWRAEERIAILLDRWNAEPGLPESPEIDNAMTHAHLFAFPQGGAAHVRQSDAVKAALRQRFSIVSGGPGTGKTTVVKMIVSALCHYFQIPLERVALCAPTGRAKARLLESVSPLPDVQAKTIHSLLRLHSDGSPSYSRNNPLPFDLIIVDEVSMVDSALFALLAEALSPQTRFVVVGDMNQLPSVETGAVLGDLTLRHPHLTTILTHNFRSERSILEWWKALPASRPFRTVDRENLQKQISLWLTEYGNLWMELRQQLTTKDTNSQQLACLRTLVESGRVLCTVNQGPFGREAWNRTCQYIYAPGQRAWNYLDGEPLIVEQNQRIAGTPLYNGDLGVAWTHEGVRYGVFYSEGCVRILEIDRVQGLSLAYAITVHKSQGSEFGSIFVVLPDNNARPPSRQLVYTAVTRAKSNLLVCDPEEILARPLPEEKRRTYLGLAQLPE